MRRPAQQHRLGSTPAPGWAHPYAGITEFAVFYNDGGTPAGPTPAPVPSPADLANRGPQQAPPPVAPPATRADEDPVLLDHGTGAPMTQAAFSRIMTRENRKGRMAAFRELAEAAGVPFTHEEFDVNAFGQMFKQAEEVRQAQLSEDQRKAEELKQQEETLRAERTRFQQEREQFAAQQHALVREQALIRLGAFDSRNEQGEIDTPNLQDALAMLERDLRDTPDADAATVTTAAEALKKRRPELFGTAPAIQTLPPAPSGGPAAGNAPRPPVAGKDAVKQAARDRARSMGLRTDDAA